VICSTMLSYFYAGDTALGHRGPLDIAPLRAGRNVAQPHRRQ
jgi:hypothetical protein